MNLRTLRLLEYNKIVEMLTSYAASPMAKRKCERLKPRRDLALIQTLQQETRDALIRLNTQGNLSFAGLRDIGASIKRLEVQGALGIKELLDIGSVLDMALSARQYGSGDDNGEKAHDSLYSRFMELVPLEHLSQEIHRCILSESMGDISVMRVCMKHCDQYLANFSFQTSCSSVPYFFDYRSSDEKTKRWYLNFADPILFVASRGGLFAQDEIQTLEHPLLCAVQSYLTTNNIKGLESYTKVGNKPTPYLFKNVPYLVEIDTQPIVDGKKVSIYGNAFSYYEYNYPEVLKRAIKVRKDCSFSNIIAMAAPSPKYGCYDKDTILEMFSSVISAFKGAKCKSAVIMVMCCILVQ